MNRFADATALAEANHGIIDLGQLATVGVSADAARQRAARKRLFRVHHGVYAIVPVSLLSWKGRFLAAVLACGPGAALSHRSAAHLHGIRRTNRRRVDVIVPGRHVRERAEIANHCGLHLEPRDLTIVDRIPVSTVSRTFIDLAAVVPMRQLERALDQAEIEELLDMTALAGQLERNPLHPGATKLRTVLTVHVPGTTATWSELEELCLAVSRGAGLPPPEVNAWIDPHDGEPPIRVDFCWRAQRVIVEADGERTHRTHRAFHDDRRRDQRLQSAGWRPLRVTDPQLKAEAPRIAATLLRLLQAAPLAADLAR